MTVSSPIKLFNHGGYVLCTYTKYCMYAWVFVMVDKQEAKRECVLVRVYVCVLIQRLRASVLSDRLGSSRGLHM